MYRDGEYLLYQVLIPSIYKETRFKRALSKYSTHWTENT